MYISFQWICLIKTDMFQWRESEYRLNLNWAIGLRLSRDSVVIRILANSDQYRSTDVLVHVVLFCLFVCFIMVHSQQCLFCLLMKSPDLYVYIFGRLILPSSSPKWQKNQLDIKMYLSGLVQVYLICGFVCLFIYLCLSVLNHTETVPVFNMLTEILLFTAALQSHPVHSYRCCSPPCKPDGALLPVCAQTGSTLTEGEGAGFFFFFFLLWL